MYFDISINAPLVSDLSNRVCQDRACESLVSYFENLTAKPTTASAEFGINFTIEGNIFVAKASTEASVKVTLNWTLNPKYAASC